MITTRGPSEAELLAAGDYLTVLIGYRPKFFLNGNEYRMGSRWTELGAARRDHYQLVARLTGADWDFVVKQLVLDPEGK